MCCCVRKRSILASGGGLSGKSNIVGQSLQTGLETSAPSPFRCAFMFMCSSFFSPIDQIASCVWSMLNIEVSQGRASGPWGTTWWLWAHILLSYLLPAEETWVISFSLYLRIYSPNGKYHETDTKCHYVAYASLRSLTPWFEPPLFYGLGSYHPVHTCLHCD